MAHGHRGVLAQEQHGHGFAHDHGAADDHGLLAAHRDLVEAEDLHHGLRRGRREAGHVAGHDLAGVHRVEAVNVLFRSEDVLHHVLADLLGKRPHHDDPVDVLVRVPLLQDVHELVLARRARQLLDLAGDAVLLRHLLGAVGVKDRILGPAHDHDPERRVDALCLELLDVLLDVLVHLLSHFFSRQ